MIKTIGMVNVCRTASILYDSVLEHRVAHTFIADILNPFTAFAILLISPPYARSLGTMADTFPLA